MVTRLGGRQWGWVANCVAFAMAAGVITAWASSARAQVAAPSIVPFTFFTDNPAAMQWGGPSRIGLQGVQAEVVTDPATVTDTLQGGGVGFRGVWQHVSFAVEGSHLESRNRPYGTSNTSDTAAAGAAVGLWSVLALGIGTQSFNSQQSGFDSINRVQVDQTQHAEDPVAGASLRLGEWFFLGAAAGKDYLHQTDNVSGFDQKVTRDFSMYGVGVRTRGAVLMHLEYFVKDFPDFQDTVIGKAGHETDYTGVVEFNFSGFLLAYRATHSDLDPNWVRAKSEDTQQVAIGYAPYTGFTVVAEAVLDKQTIPPNTFQPTGSVFINSQTVTAYALDFTYLFGEL